MQAGISRREALSQMAQLGAGLAGFSLAKDLLAADATDRTTFYHYCQFPQPDHIYPHYGLRTNQYELIHYYTIHHWELFDLSADPRKRSNLFGQPAYLAIQQRLVEQMTSATAAS